MMKSPVESLAVYMALAQAGHESLPGGRPFDIRKHLKTYRRDPDWDRAGIGELF
jgi:hypothetical protein